METLAVFIVIGVVIWFIAMGRHNRPPRVSVKDKATPNAEPGKIKLKTPNKSKVAKAPREYSTSIVGESNYQNNISFLEVGEPVKFFREPSNPFDSDAVAVTNYEGHTIGYLARDCPRKAAIVKENSPAYGYVDFIGGKPKGVRLQVSHSGPAVGERDYRADR